MLQGLQERIETLDEARRVATMPARGWLRAVREAVGLTQNEVALKMGVKRQSYAQFETAEELGSISIGSMRRAAQAMDCELVCFIVPRETVALSYAGLAQIHDPAAKHLKATEHSMKLEERGPAEDAL